MISSYILLLALGAFARTASSAKDESANPILDQNQRLAPIDEIKEEDSNQTDNLISEIEYYKQFKHNIKSAIFELAEIENKNLDDDSLVKAIKDRLLQEKDNGQEEQSKKLAIFNCLLTAKFYSESLFSSDKMLWAEKILEDVQFLEQALGKLNDDGKKASNIKLKEIDGKKEVIFSTSPLYFNFSAQNSANQTNGYKVFASEDSIKWLTEHVSNIMRDGYSSFLNSNGDISLNNVLDFAILKKNLKASSDLLSKITGFDQTRHKCIQVLKNSKNNIFEDQKWIEKIRTKLVQDFNSAIENSSIPDLFNLLLNRNFYSCIDQDLFSEAKLSEILDCLKNALSNLGDNSAEELIKTRSQVVFEKEDLNSFLSKGRNTSRFLPNWINSMPGGSLLDSSLEVYSQFYRKLIKELYEGKDPSKEKLIWAFLEIKNWKYSFASFNPAKITPFLFKNALEGIESNDELSKKKQIVEQMSAEFDDKLTETIFSSDKLMHVGLEEESGFINKNVDVDKENAIYDLNRKILEDFIEAKNQKEEPLYLSEFRMFRSYEENQRRVSALADLTGSEDFKLKNSFGISEFFNYWINGYKGQRCFQTKEVSSFTEFKNEWLSMPKTYKLKLVGKLRTYVNYVGKLAFYPSQFIIDSTPLNSIAWFFSYPFKFLVYKSFGFLDQDYLNYLSRYLFNK